MNKQQIQSILDNAAVGQTHWDELDKETPYYNAYIATDSLPRALADLRTQLTLIEENEKLKTAVAKSVGLIDSFIDEHQNKGVRLYTGSVCDYLDVRIDEHIDWSELLHALKELSND